MVVYNINRGIGWASSGVEYAQAYRARVLRELGIPARFIFTDMFQNDNLEALTSAMGFEDSEVIWLYQYFTDFLVCPCSVRPEEIEATFSGKWRREEQGVDLPDIYHFEDEDSYVRVYRKYGGFVQRVEYVLRGRLVRTDYYTCGRLFSEFYAPKDGRAKLYCRRFYNRDGSEAYVQIVDGEKKIYRLQEREFFSKEEFIGCFIHELHMTGEDVIIMDRSTEIGQGLLENKGTARLGVVIHADHWNDNLTNDQNILWNNYYEYDFDHAADTAFYITATDAQHRLLAEQFREYCRISPRIVTIPVGALKELRYPVQGRKPHSFISASRLASEKHLDWVIAAAALAHEKVPDLTLDIYGKGGEEASLRDQIGRLHAEDYIHLCGHQDLTDVYQNYETYVSASTSEGFGLTLMEAVGSGLAMIGFDVPYGNQTFIENGRNGYRIPYSRDGRIQERIDALAECMVRICGENSASPAADGTEADVQKSNDTVVRAGTRTTARSLEDFSRESYRIAERYLENHVADAWRRLLDSTSEAM